jgi:uncharacterized membrane protein YbaN (DUF454 family)
MSRYIGTKLLALILVVAFLALGLIGLVLPLIPGILFLVLAAALIARHSPAARHRMRQHRGLGRCLDHADGFLDSDVTTKIKLGALYAAKAVVDGLNAIVGLVVRLRNDFRVRSW